MKPRRNDPTAVGTLQVADAVIEKLEARRETREGRTAVRPSRPTRPSVRC